MKITRKIIIDKSATEVWDVLGRNFEQADQWMASVPKSYAKVVGTTAEGAPLIGRICELSQKPNGPIADETITHYDESQFVMHVNVVPRNGNLPIQQNNVVMSVRPIGDAQAEVSWASDLELKPVGKLLYPIVKVGVAKSFDELLEELKHFVETGTPHPRKVAKLAKLAA
ncbi:MAG: SRPBCC family protein [Bacteroidota bacterium]